mgnify:CR=1 FL=1
MVANRISGNSINFMALARPFGLYAAATLSMTAAGIHLWAAPEHLAEWWGYGTFFLITALAQGLFGVAILRWPGRSLFFAGIAGNLGIVAFYIITRTAGIPFAGPHAGIVEAAGALDLTATVAELALVAALVALAGETRKSLLYVALGVVQALGVGAVAYLLNPGMGGAQDLLRGALLAVPLSALVLLVATPLARCGAGFFFGEDATVFAHRLTWALTVAAAYAVASVPAGGGMAMRHAAAGASFAEQAGQAGRGAGVALIAGFLVLLAVAAFRGAPWETPRRALREIDLWRPRALTAFAGLATGFLIVGGPAVLGGDFFSRPVEAQAAPSCSAASYDRSYDVAAINVNVPFNRWGDVVPDGQIYVLQGDKLATKNWSVELGKNADGTLNPANDPAGADNRRLRPRPLVLRANAGECVKVDFTNEMNDRQWGGRLMNPRASMQVAGPTYDAQTSDGGAVGYNEDTTVPNKDNPDTPERENRITYFWNVPEEGLYLFRDQGAVAGGEGDGGSTAYGLYGALAVEPPGSTWTDPNTGEPIYAGVKDHDRITKQSGDPYVDADINPPGGKSFRESVQIAQDEVPGGIGYGFNYGIEPDKNRIPNRGPDSVGEETSLSSWVYGDPALVKLASGPGPWKPENDPNDPEKKISREDCGLEQQPGGSCYVSNVFRTYPNDPTKVRFGNVGLDDTHVFHMHANQWLGESKDVGASNAPEGPITDANRPESTTIDSQTFGPGETFTADLLYGAGSKPGTFGDSIFHCHLYPHFAKGFWSLMRVHDVLEDGSNKTPDGINVRPLKPLKDRAAQPAATSENPGYPRFIPGKTGWRAPQPPGGIYETAPSGVADNPATPVREDLKQDDPATVKREDLQSAMRIAAGQALDPNLDPNDPNLTPKQKEVADQLAVEKGVQNLNYGKDANGNQREPLPGAPFKNPCPSGSTREVTYNVTVIQRPLVYNERGDKDTQGRILVPTKDADAIIAGDKEPEPLFFRANAGDCINFNLTNRLPNFIGNDAFIKLAQTNMMGQHIHLVKFDVLGSDGSSNGWNYQGAAFTKDQADFNKEVLADTTGTKCTTNEATGACRLPLPNDYDPNTTSQGLAPGQTISERWYADYELRTVFSHDHHFAAVDQNRGLFGGLVVEPKGMDARNPKTGEFYQPINNPANGEVCGSNPSVPEESNKCTGAATGTAMDLIGPKPDDDFREFGLAFQDFVSLTKPGGNPQLKSDTINAPNAPEEFPENDPGTVGINYKNAPFQLRDTKNGQPVDPAYTFSSTVFGDPQTPVLNTYAGDPVRMRLIQGSQEEAHVFQLNGMRWREEPDDPDSPLVNAKTVGVSDAPNFEVPKVTCGASDEACIGDYLYSGTSIDDLYGGMWGILRARGARTPSLLPLPDNPSPDATTDPAAPVATTPGSGSGVAPPEANSPGNPCKTGAPIKRFNVVAMETKLEYNKAGDNDPYGLIYALAEDEAAIKAGTRKPEPLVLRANEGDCIEVRLTNKLTPNFLNHKGAADGDAMVATEPLSGTRAGLRVSLNPQLVKYDVRGSDGTAVGYNRDQTVAPGDTKLYRWYADDPGKGELGATNLTDYGDVRGHKHHGLFAGLNIEPQGSTYTDPKTGEPVKSGASADIRVPGPNNDFREFTAIFQDGMNLRDKAGAIIGVPEAPPEPGVPPEPEVPGGIDFEEQGEKGFNYASERFKNRLGREPVEATDLNPLDGQALSNVFSSRVNGDPDTPIFRAYAGDPTRMRVLQGADKRTPHSFQISGHAWKKQPNDPGSDLAGAQSGFSVGRSINAHLSSGAGGGFPGDYRYGDVVSLYHVSGGEWGLMRVYPRPSAAAALNPTPIGPVDDPRAGGHPLLPLEISNTATTLALDAAPASIKPGGATTLSGRLATASGPVADRPVVLEQKPAGAASFTAVPGGELRTDADGNFSLANVKPAKTTDYRAVFAGAPSSGLVGSTSVVKQVVVQAAPAPAKAASTVALNAGAPTVKLGKSRVISGAVAPAHTGKVKLTIRKPGADVVRNLPLKGSRYSFSYKPPVAGVYAVQVNFAGDGDHLASASPVRRFKVTR